MRYILVLILASWLVPVWAVDWEEQRLFEGQSGAQTLRVISSTDTAIFAPVIESFLRRYPDLNIEYNVASSADVYSTFRDAPDGYDLVVSSAMDLQLKLVNDGFAQSIDGIAHPEWAQWRRSLFGFTLESASIVINKAAFDGLPIPRSRQEMIEVLRENAEAFSGRIGTYDVRQSGLGYLFATQDARFSETYWRLMEIMGSLNTKLYCCSGAMIDDLAKGTITISYNVLGSYASARNDVADKIEVILPSDFPNTMMRTVLVAQKTPRADAAGLFLRHLISSRWSQPDAENMPLPPLTTEQDNSQRSIIALDPGLMVFLDTMKRKTFINERESAIIQQ